jgi:hypothetical protein
LTTISWPTSDVDTTGMYSDHCTSSWSSAIGHSWPLSTRMGAPLWRMPTPIVQPVAICIAGRREMRPLSPNVHTGGWLMKPTDFFVDPGHFSDGACGSFTKPTNRRLSWPLPSRSPDDRTYTSK